MTEPTQVRDSWGDGKTVHPCWERFLQMYEALLVDLDGVVTRTAAVHAAAWKRLFDEFLGRHAERTAVGFEPFYRTYVDGRPRYAGVESFLASRGIELPYGTPEDSADRETICGLGNRKNLYFRQHLRENGVGVYDAREQGLRVAVVSSSKNCGPVLEAAGLAGLFEERVDGLDVAGLGLQGKPAPDMFLEAARRLGVDPTGAVVLEDAVSGVEAGRRGGFGLVVGVDRGDHAEELRRHGAHVVCSDLRELELDSSPALPSALEHLNDIAQEIRGRRPAVFLDYDGTLTPIVDRPDLAVLSAQMRDTVRHLAGRCTVAVVSGRDRQDVEALVGLESLVYAGSHGFDIAGPGGFEMHHAGSAEDRSFLHDAEEDLRNVLSGIGGVLIEPKRYALAVHYRLVRDQDYPMVRDAVETVAARYPQLRRTGGKKIFELRPRLDWDKGKAVLWLLEALGLDTPDVLPFYLGDDLTDEDAFAVLEERGIGILVSESPEAASRATYGLRDPGEVRVFLERVIAILGEDDRE